MAFLSERLGETFEALILGFSRFGIRVELLEHLVEGICPFGGLGGDYWTVDRDGLSARGRRGGRVLKVGEVVRVRLIRVDQLMLEAQFELEASKPMVSRARRVRYNRQ
jgi:ribonuclease R